MTKIKILTGKSNPESSTFAFINLCNLFNSKGIETIMYGPTDFHINKCKGDLISNINLTSKDIIIYHFLDAFQTRPPVKKFILSLHEKDLYPLSQKPFHIFDTIHFLNQKQIDWHGIINQIQNSGNGFFICPNVKEQLKPFEGKKSRCAGIIDNIEKDKNIHISIDQAIKDGHNKIRIFGLIKDQKYFDEEINPRIKEYLEIVKYIGFVDDKQSIYDLVTDVYKDSTSEKVSNIIDDCKILNDRVFDIWKKELELEL